MLFKKYFCLCRYCDFVSYVITCFSITERDRHMCSDSQNIFMHLFKFFSKPFFVLIYIYNFFLLFFLLFHVHHISSFSSSRRFCKLICCVSFFFSLETEFLLACPGVIIFFKSEKNYPTLLH